MIQTLATGFRFDLAVGALWATPTFLLSLLVTFTSLGHRVMQLRRGVATLFVTSAILIGGADLIYFDEYNDQFNQQMFGIIHDDTRAILITIWKSYHPLLFFGITLPLIWLAHKGVQRFLRWTPIILQQRLTQSHSLTTRIVSSLLLFLLFAGAARGGSLWGEPIRLKHAFVVNDQFLNRVVINPFTAMRESVWRYMQARSKGGFRLLWPEGSIQDAAALLSPAGTSAASDIDSILTGPIQPYPNAAPPRHIFVVIIESHSGWTLLPQYQDIGLSPQLSRLADRGTYFPNFLPGGDGTIGSINAILTGLPDVGLNINYEPTALTPYPTGLAVNAKKLGYRTRFFYGGFLSWQRLDSFALAQGFDEIYGGGDMGQGIHTNEWGVDDKYLFDFIVDTVAPQTPSVNVILTTSNHPPYDLPLTQLGFPVKSLPQELTITKAETLNVLGHLWYSDQQVGRFVENAEQVLPDSLFAITGDHTSRLGIRFPGDSVAEQKLVPFILYGKGIESRRIETPGSHIDIIPTLFARMIEQERPLPKWGDNLLNNPAPPWGLGRSLVITPQGLIDLEKEGQSYGLAGKSSTESNALMDTASLKQIQALRALAWYRVRHGSKLP